MSEEGRQPDGVKGGCERTGGGEGEMRKDEVRYGKVPERMKSMISPRTQFERFPPSDGRTAAQ